MDHERVKAWLDYAEPDNVGDWGLTASQVRNLIDVARAAVKTVDLKKSPRFKDLPPLVQGILIGYTDNLREALSRLVEES